MQICDIGENSPANSIRLRFLAHALKIELTGEDNEKVKFPAINKAWLEITGDIVNKENHYTDTLSAARWSYWTSKGQRFPTGKFKEKMYLHFRDISEQWLECLTDKNRMQVHLTALELYTRSCTKATSENLESAVKIITSIHENWRPDQYGNISIPSSKERAPFNRFDHLKLQEANIDDEKLNNQYMELLQIENEELYKEVKRTIKNNPETTIMSLFKERAEELYAIPITLVKEMPTPLLIQAATSTRAKYSSSPESIISFMLSYAIQTDLEDPGLKEAFIFDFLSALISFNIISMQHSQQPTSSNQAIHKLFRVCQTIFWGANIPSARIIMGPMALDLPNICNELNITHNNLQLRVVELFMSLQETYYAALEIKGLSRNYVRQEIRKLLHPKKA